jgi:hypothetical protein
MKNKKITQIVVVAALATQIVLGLAGCFKPAAKSPTTPIVISKAELQQFFDDAGIGGNILLADEYYAVPTLSWFSGTFVADFAAFKSALDPYKAESNDCDDFARCGAFFAQFLNSNTPGRPNNAALSVGEFWYQRDAGGGHAIVAGVCRVDGTTNLVLSFMEPQLPASTTLTEMESTSCYAGRF